jgi:hypothetical protein
MVIFAVQHCGVTQDDVKREVSGASALTGLGVASLVVIAAISAEISNYARYGPAIFALTLACLTVVLVGIIIYMERKTEAGLDAVYQFYILCVFAIMWFVMACVVTFRGPFTVRAGWKNTRFFSC